MRMQNNMVDNASPVANKEPASNSEVSLRPARRADEATIERWLEEPGGKQLGRAMGAEEMLRYYGGDRSQKHALMITYRREAVGFIMVEHLSFSEDRKLNVDFFLVQRAFRGRGVGAQALRCLLDLDEWGKAFIARAWIRSDNAGSKRFFMRYGFKRV